MKFTINCDCTPEEARAFFGLPDFQPMQQAILGDMQEKMQANMNAMDPQNLMQMWMPQNAQGFVGNGMQAFSDLQKAIWDQMMGGMADIAASDEPAKKRKK